MQEVQVIFALFKFRWDIWPRFLVQETYPSSCLEVSIVLPGHTHDSCESDCQK